MAGRTEGGWAREAPFAITVCDTNGVVLEMNDRAAEAFAANGGRALIGEKMLGCHPGPARRKLVRLLASRRTNIYTIEKRGAKKIVIQAPWYRRGRYAGYVEVVAALPKKVPHFVREP